MLQNNAGKIIFDRILIKTDMNILLIAFMLRCLTEFSPEKPVISEWRGIGRNGTYAEKNLLKSWPADGPEEILTVENIGNGYGSPVFSGDLFYITGEIDSVAYIFCYNLKGEMQWQTELGKEWVKSCRGSRSAPTVADDLVQHIARDDRIFRVRENALQ
jgi:hypothetical protein